jgi:hypothetical protein
MNPAITLTSAAIARSTASQTSTTTGVVKALNLALEQVEA